MNFVKLRNELSHKDISFQEKSDLTNLTSLKLLAVSNLVIVKSVEGLKLLTSMYKKPITVLGLGSNTIIDEKVDFYLKLDLPIDKSQ